MYVVLLGPPGAGKGTQAKLLAERMGLCYISTGELFRQHAEKGTLLGRRAREYTDRGELVPDDITIAMVNEQLASLDRGRGCLLDGYPRNLAQVKALDEMLAVRGRKVERVLNLSVPPEELARRLKDRRVCRRCQAVYHVESSPPRVPGRCDLCGGELYQRKDDSPEVVRQRVRVYVKETEPLLRYYRDKGNLVKVDGVGEVEEVNRRLVEALGGKG